jgi:hypothetical protein
MYFVVPGNSIPASIQNSGCLVLTTAQNTAANLQTGWAPTYSPGSCSTPQNLPANNTILQFAQLTALASEPSGYCTTWGEPAIMIRGSTAYLAASCLDQLFRSRNYWVFSTNDLSLQTGWAYYAGPFDFTNLPNGGSYPFQNSLTEFDWAVRADSSIVAVVTPEYVPDNGFPGPSDPMQYGCVALNFTLASGPSNPFGAVVATVTDQDGTAGFYEKYGPNGCTYDPNSNTGILVVRRLVDSTRVQPAQYQEYSLIESGIIP